MQATVIIIAFILISYGFTQGAIVGLVVMSLVGFITAGILSLIDQSEKDLEEEKQVKAAAARAAKRLAKQEMLEATKGKKVTVSVRYHAARTLALRYGINANLQGRQLELTVTNILARPENGIKAIASTTCLLYTSPSPRDS